MKSNGWIIALLVIAGVGIWFYQKKDSPKREEAYRRVEDDRQREAMTTFANGLLQNCAERKKTKEKALSDLRGDVTKLSAAVSSCGTGNDGGEGKRDVKILRILSNPDVNALALKHLGSDFAGIKDSFAMRIEEALAAEEKYNAAIKEVESTFATNAQEAAGLTKKTMAQREVEMNRLRGDLRTLEKRRNLLQEEYRSNSAKFPTNPRSVASQVRSSELKGDNVVVLQSKIRDLDAEIDKKRRQIDGLTTPDAIRKFESDMLRDAQTVQKNAYIYRDQVVREIDRRLKPKVSSTAVISELEGKSIEKLRSVLATKIGECEKSIAALTEKIAAIEEFRISIPVSDVKDLVQRKEKLRQ